MFICSHYHGKWLAQFFSLILQLVKHIVSYSLTQHIWLSSTDLGEMSIIWGDNKTNSHTPSTTTYIRSYYNINVYYHPVEEMPYWYIKVFQCRLGRSAPPNFTVLTAKGAPPQDSTAEVHVYLCNLPTRAVGLCALRRPRSGSLRLGLKHSPRHVPSADVLEDESEAKGEAAGEGTVRCLLAVDEHKSLVNHTSRHTFNAHP